MPIQVTNLNRLVPGLIEKPNSAKDSQEAKPSGGGFADQLSKAIGSVNDLQAQAGQAQDAFLAGEPVELHDVMIKAEEAGLAMDLLLEVRNRLVEGYKEIMRMPV